MINWWFIIGFGIFFGVLQYFFFKWVVKIDDEYEDAYQEYLKLKKEIEHANNEGE